MSATTRRLKGAHSSRNLARSAVRPEIQALRAVAVVSVVIYHLWPKQLPGGFVGVDIFFAISGYLIIGHLLREVSSQGRINLADFWARRARRLLPAGLLVLVITGIATLVWVPTVLWKQFFSEIGASALYVQNWLLASNAVDYLAATNKPSPVEHFWSLSVEEQFYIIWPIIIVVLLASARMFRSKNPRYLLAGGLIALTVVSFVYSVQDVRNDPAAAYFVTPSRAWEFGLGGILAFFAARPPAGWKRTRALLSWLGVATIAATLAIYNPHTPFPGATALPPVVATLLVIWASSPESRLAPSFLMKLRPVQFTGDISYSLYLWHWPLIVLAPFVFDHNLSWYFRPAILVAAVLLATLTKYLVEDPARNGRLLASRPSWVSLTTTLTITLVVASGSGFAYLQTQNLIDRAASTTHAAVRHKPSCVGAAATQPQNSCPKPYAVTSLTNPAFAENDIGKGVQSVDPCKQLTDVATVMTCKVGDTQKPRTTWALVGDSHAGQYLEALDLYGKSHHVEVITYLKSWCAGTGISNVSTSGDDDSSAVTSCASWGQNVLARVAANHKISTVIFTDYTRTYLASHDNVYGEPLTAEDFVTAWQPLIEAGKSIVALRDIPSAGTEDLPDCVARQITEYDPCNLPRSVAVLPANEDPLVTAVQAGGMGSTQLVDLTSSFCDPSTCHVVIGGLIVYFGSNHMSATFSRSLAPIVGKAISVATAAKPQTAHG